MSDLTILYYTDHSLSEPLFTFCQEHLKKVAGDRPIVSVSHEPIDLGKNIAIGKQKSSWLLLYKQLLLAVENADTKYVACAEHDCLYTDEHFSFRPARDDTFYYNENQMFVQWADKNHPDLKGMYSKWPGQRLALSSLICNMRLLKDTLDERLALLDKDRKLVRELVFAGEPGLSKMRAEKKIEKIEQGRRMASSGRPVYLKKYLKDQLEKEKYGVWHSEIPVLDIRHDGNFTGPRRGKRRTWNIPYWGKFEDVMQTVQGQV
jgi:hypothetical protein